MFGASLPFFILFLHTIAPIASLSIPAPSSVLTSKVLTPFNLTLTTDSSNTLPPEPWSYPVPDGSQRTVIFSQYSNPISPIGIATVLNFASADVGVHNPTERMGSSPQRYFDTYTDDRVNLVFIPNGQATWSDWGVTVEAMRMFVIEWEAVALSFLIEFQGEPRVELGLGLLTANWNGSGAA